MIDQQLAELTPQWEAAQQNVDLTKRVAKLWEDRFDVEPTEENLDGAFYYYHHTNELVSGSDPAVARKLSTLQLQKIDLQTKGIEDWLANGGDQHEEAEAYRTELENLRVQKAELLISDAKKRVERNPTDLQLRFELGEQLVRARQYTEAIAELQRSKQNPNARLKAMNLLGQCYTEKGMLDLAVKQFQEAAGEIVGMDVTKKEILYKLGLVFERMGKKDESLKCMKDIYEVDYGYMDVAKRVESSYS
jgi:tetratricopeptide (TPR) repeat protein